MDNMLNEENTLIVTADDGSEKMLAILFTFADPNTGNDYVVATDPSNEDLIYGFRYDDNNQLIPVDPDVDAAEFDMVAEVLNAFADEIDDDAEKDDEHE